MALEIPGDAQLSVLLRPGRRKRAESPDDGPGGEPGLRGCDGHPFASVRSGHSILQRCTRGWPGVAVRAMGGSAPPTRAPPPCRGKTWEAQSPRAAPPRPGADTGRTSADEHADSGRILSRGEIASGATPQKAAERGCGLVSFLPGWRAAGPTRMSRSTRSGYLSAYSVARCPPGKGGNRKSRTTTHR